MDLMAMEMSSDKFENNGANWVAPFYCSKVCNMKKRLLLLLVFMPLLSFAQDNKVTEICGVKFGSTYQATYEHLVGKFGEPSETEDDELVFYNKSYGGIRFDVISFSFDLDKLNKVDFCILCETKEEALCERDNIAKVVGRKYHLDEQKGEMGETDYWGGFHPLVPGNYAFYISANTQKLYSSEKYPYRAHLQYGPYGYGQSLSSLADALIGMARDNLNRDNVMEALRFYSEALELRESTYGRKSQQCAYVLHNLAECYERLGRHKEAIRILTECVSIREELTGKEDRLYANSLANLANSYESIGEYATAIKIGEEVLRIKGKVYGKKHEEYLTSLCNLSAYYADGFVFEGNPQMIERANELQEEAMKTCQKVYGKNNNLYSVILCQRAQYTLMSRHFKEAAHYAEEATSVMKEVIGTDNMEYAEWLKMVALIYACSSDFDKLERVCNNASQLLCICIRRYFATMTRSERAFFWNANKRWFENDVHGITFRLMTDALRVNGYNMALFAKGILLGSEMGLTQLLLESGDQGAINLYRQLQGKKAELESLYSLPVQQRQQDASTLEREVENIEQQLLSISQSFGDYTRVLATEWTDVQRCLQKGDAAIEFVAFPLTADSAMYAAYVVRKDDKAPVFVPLFEQKQIIYNTIEVLSSAPEMSALLWKPLAPYLDNVKNIYFSPCWLLNSIPIESLPGWDGKGWVSDRWKLFRLSSTRELVKRRECVSGTDAVVYGGLKYNTSVEELVRDAQRYPEVRQRGGVFIPVDSLGIRGNQIAELPGTAFEANEVADVMNKADWGVRAQVLEGTAGTETSFKALSGKKKRIIHVATHGFYYLENEVRQSHVTGLLPSAIDRQKNAEDKALTRSGLILAGANNRLQQKTIPEGVEDGILTAQEIAMLDLRGLDLVALSACQTAQGDINGEGVFGLQRGFKKAGAGSILMSLWKVDDEATSLLMTEFYKQWINGLSKHDALEKAKMVVRGHQGWSNPNYWAAFVLLDGLD